jgi:predicted nucleic acid-binding protein
MQRTIISDTSCLIILEKIGELDLLNRVFGEIVVTQQIADEFGLTVPEWICVQNPTNEVNQRNLEVNLDKGEASAIALAVEIGDALLIIDETKGRKIAASLGLKMIGTLGVILQAKKLGKTTSVRELLVKIRQTDFFISQQLEDEILQIAGEV